MDSKPYSFNFIKKAMQQPDKQKSSWGNSFIFGKAIGEKDNPRSRLAEEKPKRKGFALND